MAMWVAEDGYVISTVREPHLDSVVTILAGRIEDLLKFKHAAPLPPFTPVGTNFSFGLHIPESHVLPRGLQALASKEHLEPLDVPVSEWPVAWYWEGVRQIDGYTGESGNDFESDYGYVWPDSISDVVAELEADGWQQVTVLPYYQMPLELMTPDARSAAFRRMTMDFDLGEPDAGDEVGDIGNE